MRIAWAFVLLAVGCGSKAVEPAQGSGGSGSGATGSGSGSGSTENSVAADPKTDLIARGEYVAALTQCEACHTGPDKQPFAGGLEVKEKFGTWRTPNITPDKSSGIGGWTDDQILTAVREGTRPDGGQLAMIMPFANYNRMTDADGKALVAYLRTRKPIDHPVSPSGKLKLPPITVGKPANLPDPATDKVKHGEYLATLMHCDACHTSKDHRTPWVGGFELAAPMLGTGSLYGANLTSDPDTGLGKWTEDQIALSLKTMTRPDHTVIKGPMLLYQPLWMKITDADLHAVAAFIKQLPAVKNKVPASTFVMK